MTTTSPTTADLPAILKPREAMAFLRMSRATFYRALEQLQIPGAFKVGSSWRIDRDDLLAGIEKRKWGKQ